MIRVIAEIGVNFTTIETAKEMIAEASRAKADYVKFQLFNMNTIKESPLKNELAKRILTEPEIKELSKAAQVKKIKILFTPMYSEAVALADRYGQDFIKIRYADRDNQKLLELSEKTGKKILASVPYMPLEPHKMFNQAYCYLYCIPKYPPEFEDFQLEVASTCHGFSSHYPNFVCDLAYAINRVHKDAIIEKHVKLLNNCYDIDGKVSVTFPKFADFVKQLQAIEKFQRIRI